MSASDFNGRLLVPVIARPRRPLSSSASTLLVAHDDIGCVQLEEPAQTIVAVDDAAIQIVQIRGRKAPAVERHERPQIRRQHRQHGQHHPLGLVARLDERLHQLQALGEAL
jgi:hypothetical protein